MKIIVRVAEDRKLWRVPKKTAMRWMREVAKIAPICDLRKDFGYGRLAI